VLVNVDIATTGFDHDMVETLITARPTMSLALYLQMVGRGTRTQKGAIDGIDSVEGRIQAIRESDKKDLTILDITDNSQKHRLVNTWTLESDKDPEERVFITKEKREKLIAAREERKLKHKQAEDQRVDLLRLPKISVYKSGKNLETSTEKQVAILKKLGYDTDGAYYTKYDATLIISELPAFDWQIRKLKSMGYDTSKGVTAGQYSKVIQQIEAEKISKPVEHNFKTLNLPFIGLE
jgi:type I site-specific restriction endonuclease